MNRAPLPAPGATHPDPVRGDDVLRVATNAMYAKYDWTLLARALRQATTGDASLMRDLDTVTLPAQGASCTQTAPAAALTGTAPRWVVPRER
ncbi:hypothetical protein AB0K00_45615 [Dactylosporangium sp. NPDC049525]|uniref:hypothetical protein n=1 Tax=Dactylosporangium sp. NPDC049525 TaxID=3154730 RepID=UPI003449448C